MKRGASSSWDVTPHWDVAPEEMEVDDEGSVQLALGQGFVHELLEVHFRGVMKARKVSVGPVSNANSTQRWAWRRRTTTSAQCKPHC